MEVGILGLAGSGKTTLFSLLTGSGSALAATPRRDQAAVGMGRVPDPRLDRLSEMYQPRKITPAIVRYVDVPAVGGDRPGEASLNIPELRTMDALLVVVRAFASDAVQHPLGSVDPARDLARIEEEFQLQDLMVVERRIERLEKDLARRRDPELAAELELLQRCRGILEEGRPLRSAALERTDRLRLRGFTFLSIKPILAVVNVGEDAIGRCLLRAPAAVAGRGPARAVIGLRDPGARDHGAEAPTRRRSGGRPRHRRPGARPGGVRPTACSA
jgi:ribosome-binding ATPase YchF (GTP1/OBG family)